MRKILVVFSLTIIHFVWATYEPGQPGAQWTEEQADIIRQVFYTNFDYIDKYLLINVRKYLDLSYCGLQNEPENSLEIMILVSREPKTPNICMILI